MPNTHFLLFILSCLQFKVLHNGLLACNIVFTLNLLYKRDGAFHDCFYRRTKSNLSLQTLKSWEMQLTYM